MRGNPLVRIALLLAAVGLLALAAASLLLHRLTDQARRDRALLAEEQVLAARVARLRRDVETTAEHRARVLTLRARAPEGLVRFVQGLEAAAARAFVDQRIAAVPPDADQGGQPYPSPVVRYRVTLLGTAEKVEAYLRELQKLPELIRVERLEMLSPPSGDVRANSTVELLLAVAVQQLP